eukprot:3375654-Pyramimonas_sp.AAC.1
MGSGGGGCVDRASPTDRRWGPDIAHPAQERAESQSGAHRRSVGDGSPIPCRGLPPRAALRGHMGSSTEGPSGAVRM